jgi:hypothetical protein
MLTAQQLRTKAAEIAELIENTDVPSEISKVRRRVAPESEFTLSKSIFA